ncbi:MAG: DUF5677 domain-containing protein [Gemmatimonadales bacterium]
MNHRAVHTMLNEIVPVPVDPSSVKAYAREQQHLVLATDLFRESAQWVVLLGSALHGTSTTWNREQAILGGHLVRLAKLMKAAIVSARDDTGDMLWVQIRLIAETLVNFRFLLANRAADIFTSYVHHSLQHERTLLDKISHNVAARGGGVLPIERRMRSSVERTFSNSQVELSSLPTKRIRDWGGGNVFERARALGLEEAYVGIFGGPSRNVHGNWQDLLQHHLVVVEPGQFTPRFEDARVRPHPYFGLGKLTVEGLLDYVTYLGVREAPELHHRLKDLLGRLIAADELHEEYLQARSGTA